MIRLPWRGHIHLTVVVRVPADWWDATVDTIADAAQNRDDQVACSGTWDPGAGHGVVEMLGYRMSRRRAAALQRRVERAISEHPHVIAGPCRCRCDERSTT